ncbi:MAG: acetyl-CoA carboxylase biotin carboxyl carrier protein subunit [candidate division Zixibacteria bacterium]|nr:acetyl-CoA carboxylase biotin carboxyl carrier protein subunit [candidate division Zixibacteria bacterium]
MEYRSDHMVATVNGRERLVRVHKLQETRALLVIDHLSHEVDIQATGDGGRKIVFMQGTEIPVAIEDYNLAQMRKAAGIGSEEEVDTVFVAPMPGLIVEIKVAPGDTVTAGQPLVVVEAMKMENILKAKGTATVKAVRIAAGQSVEKGEPLIEFE